MTNYREILRLSNLGLNRSQIADSLGVSRTTVIRTLQRASDLELDRETVDKLSDRELSAKLLPRSDGATPYEMPDYAAVYSEMTKPGVTQELLWMEYFEKCRCAGKLPYQLTQFKTHYREFLAATKATMHINRKPGEIMEVDWAGQKARITDPYSGEITDAYVFVAALPYSGYSYAEAFLNMREDAWIAAHVNAYNYFGGVAKLLVPDNLKTGVVKHTKDDIILNKSYQEMAEHYGTAILPTRVRTPKDKATVECTVGIISTHIIAALRNEQFFTLTELNEAVKIRLEAFNSKPFQAKEGSRQSWFTTEKDSLLPLPREAFELSEWKTAIVAFNYHVGVDKHYYSVPHEYIKREVQIRLTRNVVEIYSDGIRICSHIRLHGGIGKYSTKDEHMPSNHLEYGQWNGDRFRKWAEKIGENTAAVIEGVLVSHKVEQQGYRSCMALLKLGDKFTKTRLEAACSKALQYSPRPQFKLVQTILKSGQDRPLEKEPVNEKPSEFGIVRGAEYYRGGQK